MLYNDEEYGALVKDDPAGGWTRPETDYLLALAQQLDLKWTVIADRCGTVRCLLWWSPAQPRPGKLSWHGPAPLLVGACCCQWGYHVNPHSPPPVLAMRFMRVAVCSLTTLVITAAGTLAAASPAAWRTSRSGTTLCRWGGGAGALQHACWSVFTKT